MPMSNMRDDGQLDRLLIKILGPRATANPAAVFEACMFSNVYRTFSRTSGKEFANSLSKAFHFSL